jgi:hypothetical protein
MNITEPFIHRYATRPVNTSHHDECTTEEPLPATVEEMANGVILAAATRITEVKRETTDDR